MFYHHNHNGPALPRLKKSHFCHFWESFNWGFRDKIRQREIGIKTQWKCQPDILPTLDFELCFSS